jgi:hypothetical protein
MLYYSHSEALPELLKFYLRRSMRNLTTIRRLKALRLLAIFFTLIVSTAVAEAYTLVLRSGRLVEVPGKFAVTKSAVIYEVATDIQVSIQLVNVNLDATEKLNHEAPGSFLRRMQVPAIQSQSGRGQSGPYSTPSTQDRERAPAGRTITNTELEGFARSRQEAEIVSERRRKELGLPSLEESRRRAQAETAALQERFAQDQINQQSGEAYWRERAGDLRADIAAADAEINSLRQQLDWLPAPNSLASVSVGTAGLSLLPFATFGQVGPALRSPVNRTGVFVAPNRGPQISARINGAPVRHNPVGPSIGFRSRRFNNFSGFPASAAFGYQPYDFSYDRTALVMRLNELVAQRAGLQARWRALEDEARRAGAQPGWLR